MNKKLLKIVLVSLLLTIPLTIFVFESMVQAEEKDEVFQIRITSNKGLYFEGEPIIIYVEWRNVSQSEVREPQKSFYNNNFCISNEKGEQVNCHKSFYVAEDHEPEYITLKPGETFSRLETLNHRIDESARPIEEFKLPPGEYYINVFGQSLLTPHDNLNPLGMESNTIIIKIISKEENVG